MEVMRRSHAGPIGIRLGIQSSNVLNGAHLYEEEALRMQRAFFKYSMMGSSEHCGSCLLCFLRSRCTIH
jgi:hypothetical protein